MYLQNEISTKTVGELDQTSTIRDLDLQLKEYRQKKKEVEEAVAATAAASSPAALKARDYAGHLSVATQNQRIVRNLNLLKEGLSEDLRKEIEGYRSGKEKRMALTQGLPLLTPSTQEHGTFDQLLDMPPPSPLGAETPGLEGGEEDLEDGEGIRLSDLEDLESHCCVCFDEHTTVGNDLIVCTKCQKTFHQKCHDPQVSRSKWLTSPPSPPSKYSSPPFCVESKKWKCSGCEQSKKGPKEPQTPATPKTPKSPKQPKPPKAKKIKTAAIQECFSCGLAEKDASTITKCATCLRQCSLLLWLSFPLSKIPIDSYLVVHFECAGFNEVQIGKVGSYSWQCTDCKKCFNCMKQGDEGNMLLCDSCDRGFHMYCTNPPTTVVPEGDWICEICK